MAHRILQFILVVGFLLQSCVVFATGAKEAEGISRLGYSIQVGAFAEVKNAERLTAKLQGKGIEAFYFKKENGVYAVRFGDFPSSDAARKNARKLVAEKVIETYFIAVPQDVSLKRAKVPEVRKGGEKPRRVKPAGEMGAIAARTAERFVGIPYRWGGGHRGRGDGLQRVCAGRL